MDGYCNESSKRFPHLSNGENRGVKPPKEKVEAAFKEVYSDTPSTVERANVHGEKKRKMLAAIAFSKARKGKV